MTTTIIEKDNLESDIEENDYPYISGFMISGDKPILHNRIILKPNNENEGE